MFKNIGATELIIVAVIILLLFGGRKIMELIKGLGKTKEETTKDKDREEPEETTEEES